MASFIPDTASLSELNLALFPVQTRTNMSWACQVKLVKVKTCSCRLHFSGMRAWRPFHGMQCVGCIRTKKGHTAELAARRTLSPGNRVCGRNFPQVLVETNERKLTQHPIIHDRLHLQIKRNKQTKTSNKKQKQLKNVTSISTFSVTFRMSTLLQNTILLYSFISLSIRSPSTN